MPKIVEFTYGKLIRAVNKNNSTPYSDWRKSFMNRFGLIVIYKSEHKQPGKHFVFFYPKDTNPSFMDPEAIILEPAYFHTSIGELTRTISTVCIDTTNSKYVFVTGEFGLSDLDKKILLYYAGIGPRPASRQKQT